jgi:hypothetical protein
VYIVRGIVNAVGIKNFFSNCLTHNIPHQINLALNIVYTRNY